jgi:hypothetical protein
MNSHNRDLNRLSIVWQADAITYLPVNEVEIDSQDNGSSALQVINDHKKARIQIMVTKTIFKNETCLLSRESVSFPFQKRF